MEDAAEELEVVGDDQERAGGDEDQEPRRPGEEVRKCGLGG